jgi:excisionase family DNA binding protein
MPATMSDPGESDPRVSTTEAARVLGVSVERVRSMIRDGALRADRILTRRNTPAYLVTLPADRAPLPTLAQSAEPDLGAVDAPTPPLHEQEERPPMDTSARTPSDQTIAAVIQASITPIVAPLTAELAANRQMIERQVDQLVSQAEQIGRLRAELAARPRSHAPTVRRGGPRSRETASERSGVAGATR